MATFITSARNAGVRAALLEVPALASPHSARPTYLAVLTWAFTLFNSVRMLSYLPTMWAI